MKNTHTILLNLVIIFFSILYLFSCSSTYREGHGIHGDGRYDSEFPSSDCSKQLEEISQSVKMLSSIAYYHSYIFTPEAKVTRSRMYEPDILDHASKIVYLNRSSSGTATILQYTNRHILLLTCAHIIDYPDTMYSFFLGDDYKPTKYIRSVSFKERQTNYAGGITGARELDILATDLQNDIAVLGTNFTVNAPVLMPVFKYPIGRAKELEWGTFLYLFGYSSGQCMVTKGIVSNPNKDRTGSFLTDAVCNRGFSGGIILAIRDGIPNFELVGIVRLVSGHPVYHVTPNKENTDIDYESDLPYKGDFYIERRTDIDYGVVQVISSESILDFLKDKQDSLERAGYEVGSLINHSALQNSTQ